MMETLTASLTSFDLSGAPQSHQVTALVLLWSRDEPHRVGEVALVPGLMPGITLILGRENPQADPSVSRAVWMRQRPGGVESTGPLRSPHLSREQLRIQVGRTGMLEVHNIGRAPLIYDNRQVESCEVLPGDVIEIRQQAVFLCTQRPLALPSFTLGTPSRHPFGESDAFGIVGESPAVWGLRENIQFMAERDVHVLIRGASGTGKELVAQAIHAFSRRKDRLLVARNAATFPETLIDAELFGNARNYPNPGMPERPGLVGEADRSTLFLDEFGELPAAMQAHLLRVLDSGEYQRLGESRNRKADFRLIAATNRPESALKEDVLARLRLRIEVPDLNDRREDIPLLVRHLLRRNARNDPSLGERFLDDGRWPRITPGFVAWLAQRHWTTNVRELDGLLWKSMAQSRANYLDVPQGEEESAPPPSADRKTYADPMAIPADVIQSCLDKHNGKQEPVWRELGLSSRHVLTRLVRKYNLQVKGRGGD